MTRFFLLMILPFLLISCAYKDLECGSIRKQVLTYFKEKGDKQQFAAAKFLMDNMSGHLSASGDFSSCYQDISNHIDSSSLLSSALDSSILLLEKKWAKEVSYVPVEDIISPDYLILDIENAFSQWRNGEWAQHLDFDHFCEYLLPFTCSDFQPTFNWRDSLKLFAYGSIGNLAECYDYKNDPRSAIASVNTMLKQITIRQSKIFREHELPIFDPTLFIKFPKAASCSENAEIVTLIMRSKGLPVSIDFTPQWPDRANGHEWCVLWSVHGKTEQFNPFSSNPGYTSFQHQRISKVFRRTFALNKHFLKVTKKHPELMTITGTPFFSDVTNEYTAAHNISVKLNRFTFNRIVYLSVFDNERWRPIWYGKSFGKIAHFKGIGADVMYLAMIYRKGFGYVPISAPFHLTRLGQVNYVKPDLSQKCDFRIERKYPMHQHVYLVSTLRNGIIEASNDKQRWDTIKVLPKWPLTSGYFIVSNQHKFRYWRFSAIEKRVSDMAEIFFYSEESNEPIKDFLVNDETNGYEKLFDGDLLTYYSAKGHDYYGCIDFGLPQKIDKIEYVLRGDGNAIMPGDTYQVSWWNGNTWNQIVNCTATDIWLDIKDAPKDALFYIKDISSGIENRIFQFSGNEIIWH